MNIEQILDTMDMPHNFDRAQFLIYVKYMSSTVKTIPPNIQPYYRPLYMRIKTIHDRQFLRSML